jgi:hypothetical protein
MSIWSLLADEEGGESPIPTELRATWNRIPEFSRAKALTKVLHRAIYHPAAGRISLELKNADAWESLAIPDTRGKQSPSKRKRWKKPTTQEIDRYERRFSSNRRSINQRVKWRVTLLAQRGGGHFEY